MAGVLILAATLAVAGAMKLAAPDSGAAGRALGALELIVAAWVTAHWRPAEALAALMLWSFAAWMTRAVARGRSGEPCPCFGGRTRIGRRAVARTVALAALASAVAAAPAPDLSTAGWLGLLVAGLACGCAALAALAFALAREVAVLRLRVAPAGALELDGEGPPLGVESPLIERFPPLSSDVLAIAVFASPGCRLCSELDPAVQVLAGHPATEVVVLDEEQDALAWETAGVPGSPYAVAMTSSGTVLAKGTFNTPEQLESVPATALRRLHDEGLARA